MTPEVRKNALLLTQHGGSPIGNSRVKLTNVRDCVKRGLVKEGEDPLKVAADQLVKDGVDVLHTIGGDDTNTTAADLAAYLAKNNYKLIVVGLPKTIDNDVYPIKQSLGAYTAAEEGAQFFANVVKENSANPRSLIIHEVMGRNCGWLTAFTAIYYTKLLKRRIKFLPEFGLTRERQSIHAVYVPESRVNFQSEAERLRKVMDKYDCVNIFVSEGACVKEIIKEMKKRGEDVPMDAFGHPRLDKVQRGPVVREALRRASGRGEDPGVQERLLRPLGRAVQEGPRTDQGLRREGRRVRPRGRRRRRGQGRGQPQRAPRVRVRAHQGRQALQRAQLPLPQAPDGHRAAASAQDPRGEEVTISRSQENGRREKAADARRRD